MKLGFFPATVASISFAAICAGCGAPVLDGSTEQALIESYRHVKESVPRDKLQAFDLAFQQGRIQINEAIESGKAKDRSAQDELRKKIYSGKNADQLIDSIKEYTDAKLAEYNALMADRYKCLHSYDGLKPQNIRVRNAPRNAEKALELSYELYNGSRVDIHQIQIHLQIEVFGAPDQERFFLGGDFLNCTSVAIIKPHQTGKMLCTVPYNMDYVKFDGPAEDLQVFKMDFYDTDTNILDGKREKDSLGSCRDDLSAARELVETYSRYSGQLVRYH